MTGRAVIKASSLPGGPRPGEILCHITEIEDGRAREFTWRAGDEMREIFIHRQGDRVFAYENSCPHAYLPLNMKPEVFTEKSGRYFMCSNHGALFDIESGLCLAGPCNGEALTAIDIEMKDGAIIAR